MPGLIRFLLVFIENIFNFSDTPTLLTAKKKHMKTIFKIMITLLAVSGFTACEKEEIVKPDPSDETPISVKFGEDQSFAENAGPKTVELIFSKPANLDGELSIRVVSGPAGVYQTEPPVAGGFLEIPFAKGDDSVHFTFTPADNDVQGGGAFVSFEISGIPQGFVIGEKRNLAITILDDEVSTVANFASDAGTVLENKPEGVTVNIFLSAAATHTGKLIIQQSGASGNSAFIAEPAFNPNGILELTVPAGATAASFKIVPVDNPLLTGHQTAVFTVLDATGGVIRGEQISFELTVLDDELVSKPKSYETTGGGWRSKKTYEYDQTGRVAKVHWETETPGWRNGTETYYYGSNDRIERINRYPNHDEYFFWENGRIVRSENIENGIKKSYTLYDYDPAGNIGGKTDFHRQANGEYKQGFIFVYLYTTDGNIYKQLVYNLGADPENPELISTRSYEHYLQQTNPFPTFEVIPNVNGQPNLPQTYRLEENGVNLLYNFTYEFREDGSPTKRTATGPSGSESTTYQYY